MLKKTLAQWAQQNNSWATHAKRFEAFTVIVGGGAIVVLLVFFIHSPQWQVFQECVLFPLVMTITIVNCIAVMGAILWFHLG